MYEYQIYNSGGEVAKAEGKADEAAPVPKEIQQEIIASPLIGNIVPLNRVTDQVFASGAMDTNGYTVREREDRTFDILVQRNIT